MAPVITNRTKLIFACALIALLAGAFLCWRLTHRQKMVYTSEGYGGYVPAQSGRERKSSDPLAPAVKAYNAGKYREAEAIAERIRESASKSKDPAQRKRSAQAQYVLAFSAARRKDMALARDRFADLQQEASKLPDKGKQDPIPGQVQPTLTEEGAYQHAVCTAALGNKKAAEAEYMKFISDYPESPLINGALKRISLLHNGHCPAEAEAAWTRATKIAEQRQFARDKAEKMKWATCGPECAAEFLRRSDKNADTKVLSKELKTNEQGTSLLSMMQVLKKQGLATKGLSLTQKGLSKQPLPLIALISPGHYIIVERVTPDEVTVWDPFGNGPGKPSTKRYTIPEWERTWQGVALVVEKQGGRP